ncbi:MAG TPA: hypothetical protein VE869_03620, partial [Gemmatimonas sp.]|nr:hypothetical protein [Gemmatimonas sp.]
MTPPRDDGRLATPGQPWGVAARRAQRERSRLAAEAKRRRKVARFEGRLADLVVREMSEAEGIAFVIPIIGRLLLAAVVFVVAHLTVGMTGQAGWTRAS